MLMQTSESVATPSRFPIFRWTSRTTFLTFLAMTGDSRIWNLDSANSGQKSLYRTSSLIVSSLKNIKQSWYTMKVVRRLAMASPSFEF